MKKLSVLFFLIAVLTIFAPAEIRAAELDEDYVPDPAITAMIASNPQIIEEKLKAAMLKQVHNPASITIEITPNSVEDTALGKFKRVYVDCYRSEIEECVLHSAKFEFLDVQLNTKRLIEEDKIKPVNKCTINIDAIVKESDINTFLTNRAKKIGVDHPKIKMTKDGNLELSGACKYGFVKVEFWARGNFSLSQKDQIWFHASKMKVNRIAMPRNFVGMIVKKINPVLKFDKFSFKVNLETIKITEGEMRLTSEKLE